MTITVSGLAPTAFADRYFTGWNEQRLDALSEYYTHDVVYRDLSLGTETHGLGELAAFMRGAFEGSPDMRFETLDVIVEGADRLAIKWRMTGTSDGATYATEGVSWLQLNDGKVADNSDYYK
jgi:steroid delta-isomerase-like uncharacterized protein